MKPRKGKKRMAIMISMKQWRSISYPLYCQSRCLLQKKMTKIDVAIIKQKAPRHVNVILDCRTSRMALWNLPNYQPYNGARGPMIGFHRFPQVVSFIAEKVKNLQALIAWEL